MPTLFPETRQRPRESFRVYKRYGSLKTRGDGTEMCQKSGEQSSGRTEVEDDEAMRRRAPHHDGEERQELPLVLFSHPVSESELICSGFAHNLFQTALSDCSSSLRSRFPKARL